MEPAIKTRSEAIQVSIEHALQGKHVCERDQTCNYIVITVFSWKSNSQQHLHKLYRTVLCWRNT